MYRTLKPLTTCLLCSESKPLVNSHVVPHFFRKWIAQESGLEPRFHNPNTRVGRYHDDLAKHRLCCVDCERVMSRDESIARSQLLIEWKRDDANPGAYGPWLARFAAGLCAKAVAVQLHSTPSSKSKADKELPFNLLTVGTVPTGEGESMTKALEVWRHFVLGKTTNPGRFELHLLEVNVERFPGLRGLFGHNTVHYGQCSGVFIWLNGIAIVGVLRGSSYLVRRPTRLAVRQGVCGAPNQDATPFVEEVFKRISDANVATWALGTSLQK